MAGFTKVSGELKSLLRDDNEILRTMGRNNEQSSSSDTENNDYSYVFYRLFKDCEDLVDAQDLVFP
jgi:hypothetical protein